MALVADPGVVHGAVHFGSKGVTAKPTSRPSVSTLDIIDIRRSAVEINLKDEIRNLFQPQDGARSMPTLLLYNERGLQLFEDITYLDEYYLTNDEIEALKACSIDFAARVPNGSMIIELGSGNLRKVNLLLQALESAGREVDYYALDLSKQELERTLAQLPKYKFVRAHGLWGTYDDGREWLKLPGNLARQKCILSLGSSIGNFNRDDASDFLRGFTDVLQEGDGILVGLDSCHDPAKVYHAYNDSQGLTHQFILNGLDHANEILGAEAFKKDDWEVIGEYVYDVEGGRHHAFYSPVRNTVVMGEVIRPHERIQVEQSLKYSKMGAQKLWRQAGLSEVVQWNHRDEYGLHFLTKNKMSLSLLPSVYANQCIPSKKEWESLWEIWDTVTQGMIPYEELHAKPIKLRNACIFYLGHIPAFLDIQLVKTTGLPPTEPAAYHSIFERGIDPDVDNPEQCHAHSEIPDEWPSAMDIIAYQSRVRSRVKSMYASGLNQISREVCRAIWLGFEHEAMHLETLLYMMLQSDKTLAPPHMENPDFESLAVKARDNRVPNQWFRVPRQSISIGMNDQESSLDSQGHFGWDNEKPARQRTVHEFEAKGRPITNGEYAEYMYKTGIDSIPASWATLENAEAQVDRSDVTNGHGVDGGSVHNSPDDLVPLSFLNGKAVRTVFGNVPLRQALDWPVFASYDEVSDCAQWMGGRIPTFEETRSIYTHVNTIKKKLDVERTLGRTVPAVNSHLINDGVEESPPLRGSQQGTVGEGITENDELFVDLDRANVGFHNWHPVSVTDRGDQLAGQGEMGGAWEWTSSPLRRHDGFEPMSLYPGYTADFFDDKHNIVLGGSWATHPRIAGRKSFVNWYQRNYPFAWAGARLVRDVA